MKQCISLVTVFCFVFVNTLTVFAQSLSVSQPTIFESLPITSAVSNSLLQLNGIKVDLSNPFEMDFIIAEQREERRENSQIEADAKRLIKYFLAALTTPHEDMWVNLSPYEQNRIIPQFFGETDMGKDMLIQDYVLKQLTSSLLHPDNEYGSRFWKKVHEQAFEQYGTTEIPMDSFHKVWIAPDGATVYEGDGSAYVVDSKLKVMLESDYVAQQSQRPGESPGLAAECKTRTCARSVSTEVMREIIIPAIEHEVNEGVQFSQLRQMYHALVLATWYKRRMKEAILNQVYGNQNKTEGINHKQQGAVESIWQGYAETFKEGAYNFIKEEYDSFMDEVIPRQYFSGGVGFQVDLAMSVTTDQLMVSNIRGQGELQNMHVKLDAVRRPPPFSFSINREYSRSAQEYEKLPENIVANILDETQLMFDYILDRNPQILIDAFHDIYGEVTFESIDHVELSYHDSGAHKHVFRVDVILDGKKDSFLLAIKTDIGLGEQGMFEEGEKEAHLKLNSTGIVSKLSPNTIYLRKGPKGNFYGVGAYPYRVGKTVAISIEEFIEGKKLGSFFNKGVIQKEHLLKATFTVFMKSVLELNKDKFADFQASYDIHGGNFIVTNEDGGKDSIKFIDLGQQLTYETLEETLVPFFLNYQRNDVTYLDALYENWPEIDWDERLISLVGRLWSLKKGDAAPEEGSVYSILDLEAGNYEYELMIEYVVRYLSHRRGVDLAVEDFDQKVPMRDQKTPFLMFEHLNQRMDDIYALKQGFHEASQQQLLFMVPDAPSDTLALFTKILITEYRYGKEVAQELVMDFIVGSMLSKGELHQLKDILADIDSNPQFEGVTVARDYGLYLHAIVDENPVDYFERRIESKPRSEKRTSLKQFMRRINEAIVLTDKGLKKKVLTIADQIEVVGSESGQDSAMQTDNDALGGIDFNPDQLDINLQGEEGSFNGINLSSEQIDQMRNSIRGFSPVIINISPVQNLPMLLGVTTQPVGIISS